MIRALSYNEHVCQLTTIWHGLGKYKAKHHQEIICSSRQNCANLGVQRALIAITVLPLTGIFLCALIEKVVIFLPKGRLIPRRINNISISIQGWTMKLVQRCFSISRDKREHKFLVCHTWISSFKNTTFQCIKSTCLTLLQIPPSTVKRKHRNLAC